MLSSFLITFREGLEAALIIGIMVAYLSKIKKGEFNKYMVDSTSKCNFGLEKRGKPR